MGEYKESGFYDQAFVTTPEYSTHYTQSIRYPQWQKVLSIFKGVYVKENIRKLRILEIGCGVGQFAQMMSDKYDDIVEEYLGIDFSGVGCEETKKKLTRENYQVMQGDISGGKKFFTVIMNSRWLKTKFDVVVALETLEHLQDDVGVLESISDTVAISKAHLIATVPDFDSNAHVRLFRSDEEIKEHYKSVVNFINIEKFGVGLIGGSEFICVGRFL